MEIDKTKGNDIKGNKKKEKEGQKSNVVLTSLPTKSQFHRFRTLHDNHR